MSGFSQITPESILNDLRYLELLSRSFPTIADASTEIINLELSPYCIGAKLVNVL